MPLGKPPIVEVWIEFSFDPSPDAGEWGWELARSFLERFAERYPQREVLLQNELQLMKLAQNQLPRVVSERSEVRAARALTADGTRCLQLARDQLVCNLIRSQQEGYPGFDSLCAEAVERLADFAAHFRPQRLLQAAVHYVDLIEIPLPENGQLTLADYFVTPLGLPDRPFGPLRDFSVHYVTAPDGGTDGLHFRLASEPLDRERNVARFRMDWHMMASEGLSFDAGAVRARLNRLHDCLFDCFRNSFTDRGWSLFEPPQQAG